MAKTPFMLTVISASPANPLTVPAGKNLIVTWSHHTQVTGSQYSAAIGALSGAVFGPGSYSKADLMVGPSMPMVLSVDAISSINGNVSNTPVTSTTVTAVATAAMIRGWLVDA